VRAVIFDCDGTLVDSEGIAFRVIHRHACELGLAGFADTGLQQLRGRSMASCLAALEAQLGRPLPEDFEAQLRRSMAEVFRRELQPMPGASWLLGALHVPFCVASNGPRAKTELTLGLTGLLPQFTGRIFSAYDVQAFKPDPGLFLTAARSMGIDAARCAVVEDSVPGMRAGLAAGMAVYAMPGADMPDDLLSHVHPLGDLRELARQAWNRPPQAA
jgi:HAD superfamily hydrolase (TIGR01509 family)